MTANPDSIVQLYNGMGYEEAKDSLAVAKEWLVGKSCIKYFIDGKLKTTLEKGAVESVEDQCTGEKLCSLRLPTRDEIATIFQSSTQGHKVWSDLKGNSRGNFLSLVAKKLEEKKDLLSEIEAMSMGSNVKREEAVRACSYFHYYATWAHCIKKDADNDDGVVLVTLPSPAPLFALTALVASALAAGSAVVLNPSSWAPLSSLLLAELCSEARLPAGVVNVLPGPLTSFKEHLAVSVTRVVVWGSKLGCRQVFDQLAAIPVPLFPFYYGKTVSIIFDSSDKTSAVDILLKNMNFGYNQSPWSVRTVLVEEAALEWVATALKQRLSKALVGSSRSAGVDVGVAEKAPSEAEQLRLRQALNEMNTRGVEVYQRTASSGIFFPPTLLIGSDSESNVLVKDYDVLPFVSVVPFRRAKDAIAFANKGQFGVAASVWTSCLSLALHMAENLQVGTVWINDHGSVDASVPFPNKKHGFATFGGIQGLQQLLEASRCLTRSAPVDEVMKVDDTKRDIVKEYCPLYGGSYRAASGLTSFYVPCAEGGYFQLSNCDWNDVRKALDAARTAGSVWAKQSPSARTALLMSAAERVHSTAKEFLKFFSSGGVENVQLVEGAVDALHSAAFTCNALSASECTRPLPNTTVHVVQKPRGVVGIVADSSSLFQTVVTAIAAAISYGNSVVVIPDSTDPVPILELCALLNLTAPGGLINVIPSKRSSLLPVLASERDVEAVWYIGDNADSWKLLLAGANKAGKLLWKFQNGKEPLNNSLRFAATHSKAVWMPCENVSC